jgi:DNA end-binding protein Ku
LESAEQERKIRFHLLDRRDHAPIGYKQINKNTQREVPPKDVIKGYEYTKGKFVLMSDADFKQANQKATSTITIEDFVDVKDVDLLLFERPYYVIPESGAEKGYVLLREVLKNTGKAAIATVVLHTVQHLVALLPRGEYIILEILRFANEVVEVDEAKFINPRVLKEAHISPRELAVAEKLVEGMSSEWRPAKYHNRYHDDLMELIQDKIRSGTTEEIEEETPAEEAMPEESNVINLMELLQKSLKAGKGRRSHGERRT